MSVICRTRVSYAILFLKIATRMLAWYQAEASMPIRLQFAKHLEQLFAADPTYQYGASFAVDTV